MEDLTLSAETLAALNEFAIDNGIIDDDYGSSQQVISKIHDAIDSQQAKEDTFDYQFTKDGKDSIEITLRGFRKDLGQTLPSTGYTLWRAADTLSEFIYENEKLFQDRDILELGAGLGLCGILAAKCKGRVTITDGDDTTLDLLQTNCELNEVGDIVQVQKLLWSTNEETQNSQVQKFDVIIGSDIVYEETYVTALFQTAMRHFCPHGIFYLAYTKRNVSIDYVLDQAKLAGFHCQKQPEHNKEGMYEFVHVDV